MSFNPASGPIANPTTFPRSIGTSMPPSGSVTNGVPIRTNVMGKLPHLGNIGTTTLYDNARHYDGSQLSANEPLNDHIFIDKTESRPHHTGTKQLLWARVTNRGYKTYTDEYKVLGWSSMNHHLMHKSDFKKYAIGTDCSEFMKDYKFIGGQIREQNENVDTLDSHVQAITVSRSHITYSLWSALKYSTNHHGGVKEGDVLWKMIIRVKRDNEINNVFADKKWVVEGQLNSARRKALEKGDLIESKYDNEGDSSMDSNNNEAPCDYRLQIVPWVGTNREKPPSNLYIEEDRYDSETGQLIRGFTGCAVMIGRVQAIYRSSELTPTVVRRARNALCPSRDDASYLADLLLLPEVHIMLCLS